MRPAIVPSPTKSRARRRARRVQAPASQPMSAKPVPSPAATRPISSSDYDRRGPSDRLPTPLGQRLGCDARPDVVAQQGQVLAEVQQRGRSSRDGLGAAPGSRQSGPAFGATRTPAKPSPDDVRAVQSRSNSDPSPNRSRSPAYGCSSSINRAPEVTPSRPIGRRAGPAPARGRPLSPRPVRRVAPPPPPPPSTRPCSTTRTTKVTRARIGQPGPRQEPNQPSPARTKVAARRKAPSRALPTSVIVGGRALACAGSLRGVGCIRCPGVDSRLGSGRSKFETSWANRSRPAAKDAHPLARSGRSILIAAARALNRSRFRDRFAGRLTPTRPPISTTVEDRPRPATASLPRIPIDESQADPLHPRRLLADLSGLPRHPADDQPGRPARPRRLRDLPRPAQHASRSASSTIWPPPGTARRRPSGPIDFPAYKAQRGPMPEDMVPQIPTILRVFEAFPRPRPDRIPGPRPTT